MAIGRPVRIECAIDRGLLEQAIRHVVGEAESLRASTFEVKGKVFQKAIDDPDVELAFYDLTGSRDPAQEARDIASSIQGTPMPLTGPLGKCALFRTRSDEYYWFTCGHHIVSDGLGIALTGRRIAVVYSALVAGSPSLPGSSAHCTTWSVASSIIWPPPIIWRIRLIGPGIFVGNGNRLSTTPVS